MEFFSRKNKVTLETFRGEQAVKKRFFSEKSMHRELNVLAYLESAGLRIEAPKILSVEQEKNTIYLEYIPGRLLSDFAPEIFLDKLSEVVDWLRKLHLIGLAKGDNNPRNFLIYREKVYGLDFEESHPIILGNRDMSQDLVDLMSTSILVLVSKGLPPDKTIKRIMSIVTTRYGDLFQSEKEYFAQMEGFLRRRSKYRPEKAELFGSIIDHLVALKAENI